MDRIQELQAMFDQEPYGRTLGAKLDHLEPGRAVISLTLAPHLAIVSGAAQAGVTLSLGDYAGVYAAMSVLPAGFTPASSGDGYFTRPVKIGQTMRAEARVEDGTKTCVIVRVDVYANGKHVSGQTWKYSKPKT